MRGVEDKVSRADEDGERTFQVTRLWVALECVKLLSSASACMRKERLGNRQSESLHTHTPSITSLLALNTSYRSELCQISRIEHFHF